MTDISLIHDEAWQEAKRRAKVIRPLVSSGKPYSQEIVRRAAEQLGLSERQIYELIRRFRLSNGSLSALVPSGSSGGRGKSRIGKNREELLHNLIADVYLTVQRLTAASFIREIRHRCQQEGIRPPSDSTIRRRLKTLSSEERKKRGEQVSQNIPVTGKTPNALYPLDRVQIDHTKADIILVDPKERQPIGRPWLTVAIDVFSRCIAGIHLSLEAPSVTSVGLCLLHAVFDKSGWLAERGISRPWPIEGKPKLISVDNGREFHSAAFERGCEQHGIEIHWRPPGQPHFGGIIERVMGSLMKLVHELPGTTFSNPTERGEYDSDAMACLTLEELEHWLAVAITGVYHQRPHGGLAGETPLSRYKAGMQALEATGQLQPVIKNPRAFLIDFLPMVWRRLQRSGITIDHITYFSPALSPWISRRDTIDRLLIRRDPRDISRIYLFDPESKGYLEIPYRDLSRPAISLWEHRMAIRNLREQRREEIDETALFQAVAEMRSIEKQAVTSTRAARRNRVRRDMSIASVQPDTSASRILPPTQDTVLSDTSSIPLKPFDEIEAW